MKNPHTHLGCKGFVLDVICYTACTFRCLFTPSESAKQDFEKEHNGGTENITDCIKELIHMVLPPIRDLCPYCIIQIFPKAMSYRLIRYSLLIYFQPHRNYNNYQLLKPEFRTGSPHEFTTIKEENSL